MPGAGLGDCPAAASLATVFVDCASKNAGCALNAKIASQRTILRIMSTPQELEKPIGRARMKARIANLTVANAAFYDAWSNGHFKSFVELELSD